MFKSNEIITAKAKKVTTFYHIVVDEIVSNVDLDDVKVLLSNDPAGNTVMAEWAIICSLLKKKYLNYYFSLQ